MCTYLTRQVQLGGSGRFGQEWRRLSDAVVYFDHPQDAPVLHALCLDLRPQEGGIGERLAVEMDADSARRLAETILQVLADEQVRALTG